MRALHGLTRSLVANMVHRCEGRLRAQARDRRHRLPARRCRARTSSWRSGYSHPVIFPLPDGHHGGGRQAGRHHPARRRQGAAGPDGGQAAGAAQARSLQGQGHQVRRRGASAARSARRRARNDQRSDRSRAARQAAPPAARGWVRGTAGSAAAGGVPQPQSHLRPGRRRRGGHARWSRWTAARRTSAHKLKTRRQRGGGQGWWASCMAQRAKAQGIGRAWSSIAAATSTTGG